MFYLVYLFDPIAELGAFVTLHPIVLLSETGCACCCVHTTKTVMSVSILSKLHPTVTWQEPGVPDSLLRGLFPPLPSPALAFLLLLCPLTLPPLTPSALPLPLAHGQPLLLYFSLISLSLPLSLLPSQPPSPCLK